MIDSGVEIGDFEIENLAHRLIEDAEIELERNKSGYLHRYCVYKVWAAEAILRYIFEQVEPMDVVLLDDVYTAVEQFDALSGVAVTYGGSADEIFSAALNMSGRYFKALDELRSRSEVAYGKS